MLAIASWAVRSRATSEFVCAEPGAPTTVSSPAIPTRRGGVHHPLQGLREGAVLEVAGSQRSDDEARLARFSAAVRSSSASRSRTASTSPRWSAASAARARVTTEVKPWASVLSGSRGEPLALGEDTLRTLGGGEVGLGAVSPRSCRRGVPSRRSARG